MKVLVVIPAYVFDQIPVSVASLLDKKKEEESDDEPELRTEVVLEGKDFKKNMRLMFRTFQAWQKYQAMFYTLQGGRIKQATLKDPNKYVNFYVKSHSRDFQYFKEAMDDLLDKNGFLLRNKKHRLAADKIKITFALPGGGKPYRIEKVEAKYKDCEYEPCTVEFLKFQALPSVNNPTLLNYIAKADESIVLIRDLEETPWVDWLDTYSYPKLQISYGDVQESNIPCVDIEKNPDQVDDAMFALDFDMGDMLQWLLAQFNCKTLSDLQDYDPFKDIAIYKINLKLLEGFTFTDNDAIKDLFGLPIDMKSMRGKKPIELINDFFEELQYVILLLCSGLKVFV